MANAAGMVVGGQKIPAMAEGTIYRYTIVKQGTIGTQKNYILVAGAGEQALGIVDEDYVAGEPASVQIGGTALLILGSGGATAGNTLKADSSGYGVVASAANDQIIAKALETGDASDIITVQVLPGLPQYHS